MAYNIRNLRQQSIFDDYPSMNIMDGTSLYEQQPDNDPGFTRTEPSSYDPPYNDPGIQPFDPSKFGPNIPIQQPPPRVSQNNSPYDIQQTVDAINKVYTPETRAGNRFNTLLDNAPVREEPSLMRRFAAAGVGLGNRTRGIPGGLGEQEKVLYAPYIRDMMEWTAKTTPFSQAAQQENTANVNERTLAGNVVQSITAANRQADQSRIADERNQTAQEKIRSAERIAILRNNVDRMKQGGWKFETKGPEVIATRTNPDTGQAEVVPTGVKTGELSQFELENLKGEWNVKAREASGAASTKAATIRATITMEDEAGNLFTFDPTTRDLKPKSGSDAEPQGHLRQVARPGGGAAKPPTATDDAKRRQNAIQSVYDNNPEYRQWIDINTFQIKPPPSGGVMGTSAKQKRDYDQMKAKINNIISGNNSSRIGTNTNQPGDNLGGVLPSSGGVKPRYQQDPDTGEMRVSQDGGRTWRPYRRGGQ